MWYLVDEGGSKKTPLLPEKEYIIGRKDCDIVLESDQSISRRHASITVAQAGAAAAEQSQVAEQSSVVTLTDLSKFGTQVNGESLNGTLRALRIGDVLTFGQYKIILRVQFEPIEVTTSCLDGTAKRTLQVALRGLGVRLVKEWQPRSTTHLVMSRITVTPKTVCCLIEQRPIVTPEFFTEFLSACQERRPLPSAESYSPELTDSQVNPLTVSFKPNPVRATIFNGKKFIFMQRREFVLLSHVIELAGGRCLLMEGRPRPPADSSELVSSGSIVIHADERDPTLPHETKQWIIEARRLLKLHNRRMVQEAEIGYAVLYGSTDCYCNPDREAGRQLFLSMSQSVTSTQQPLAVDTQPTLPERSVSLPSRTISEGKSTLAVTVVPNSVASSSDDQSADVLSGSKRGPSCEGGASGRKPSGASAAGGPTPSSSSSPPPVAAAAVHSGCAAASSASAPALDALVGSDANDTADMALRVDLGSSRIAADVKSAAAKRPAPPCRPVGGLETSTVPPSAIHATPIVTAGRRGDPTTEAAAAPEGTLQLRPAAAVATVSSAATAPSARRPVTDDDVRSGKRARSPSPTAVPPRHAAGTARPLVEQPPTAPRVRVKREAAEDDVASGCWTEWPRLQASELQSDRPGRSVLTAGETQPRPASDCARPERNGETAGTLAIDCRTGGDLAPESGGVNVLIESLVRRTAPELLPAADRNNAGLTLWNGKWVKNFKRFLKCGQRELEHLPRIIGGGDLADSASLKRARTNDGDSDDYGTPHPPVAASRSIAAVRDRGVTLAADDDDDDMDDSSQQSRVNAIFHKFATR